MNVCGIPCAAELHVEFVSFATLAAALASAAQRRTGSFPRRANVCTAVVGTYIVAPASTSSTSWATRQVTLSSGPGSIRAAGQAGPTTK